jgi:hypothetical protein
MQPVLREAVAHLSWLLTRNYAFASALKLVGDRFQLTQRQRVAVIRSSCSDQAVTDRKNKMLDPGELGGQAMQIDGFNLLTTIEAALSGGVLLVGRDGCLRDMASMHGNYRKVEETRPALTAIGELTGELGVSTCHWLLDRPVSNSGRLAAILREVANERHWNWTVDLENDPDQVLAASESVVVSADAAILDRCSHWCNLAWEVVNRLHAETDVLDLRQSV